jgi:hypothetical protein
MKKLLIIALLVIGCSGESDNCPVSFISPMYEGRISEFKANPVSGGISYMGDSRIWLCAKYYPEFFTDGIHDRGIGGAVTTDMINLAHEVVNAENPEAVVVLIGVNDIGIGRGECLANDIERLNESIDAPMFLLIPPVDLPTYDGIHYDRASCMQLLNTLEYVVPYD